MTNSEIVLQFVHENNLASNAIAWFSHGKFSHVEAIWPGHTFIEPTTYGSYEKKMDGIPSGVQFRPVGYNKKIDLCVHCHIPATEKQVELWKEWMREQWNKDYDWRAIWGFVAGRNWRDPGKWICSELQARALEVCGIVPELYLPTNRITPVALALTVSAIRGVWFEPIALNKG